MVDSKVGYEDREKLSWAQLDCAVSDLLVHGVDSVKIVSRVLSVLEHVQKKLKIEKTRSAT